MRRRRNPDPEQYELLSGDTLKAIILFGGVAIAAMAAYRIYEKAKASDTVSRAQTIKIPVTLPKPVKPT